MEKSTSFLKIDEKFSPYLSYLTLKVWMLMKNIKRRKEWMGKIKITVIIFCFGELSILEYLTYGKSKWSGSICTLRTLQPTSKYSYSPRNNIRLSKQWYLCKVYWSPEQPSQRKNSQSSIISQKCSLEDIFCVHP